MIKRRALIISNPGEKPTDENYCRGVFVDVANYKDFLISPLGGAWFEWEIQLFPRPTCKEIEAEVLRLRYYDYTMILFTGHGGYSTKKQTTMLEFRDNELYDSLNLRQGSNKRTIILDCCRKPYPERLEEKSALDAMTKRYKLPLNRTKCREAYDKEIEQCPNCCLVCYSCREGEVSGDDGSIGGYYASSLIRVTNKWHDQNKVDPYYYDAYSMVQTHNAAIPYVSRLSGGLQNPDISKSKSGPYLPFAVMAA